MSSPPATEEDTANHLYNYLIIYLDLHHLTYMILLLFPAKYLLRINSLAMIAMEIFWSFI
jgi:hypothetical protein